MQARRRFGRWWVVLALAAGALAGCGQPGAPVPGEPSAVTSPGPGTATPSTSGSPAAQSVRLTMAGDYNSTDDTDQVLRRMAAVAPDANLILGDLSYAEPGTESTWCSFVARRTGSLPQVVVAGNHESDGINGQIDNFLRCLTPPPVAVHGEYGRQFYLDLPAGHPLVRLVLISPGIDFGAGEWSYAAGGPRYRWTEAAIQEARAAGEWVIVGMHRPCISIGRYPCAGPDLMNLLLSEKVDLVVSGHEHLYQRSKQVTNQVAGCAALPVDTTDQACVVSAGTSLTALRGTVFVTVGTGGTPLRDVYPDDPEAGYFATWSGANASASHGFLNVEITPKQLSARFDNAGTGDFSDAFTIARG